MRTILKSVVALTAVTAVWFSATDASAFGHRRWGSSGGSWGSSGGSSGGSWGSSGGSWGSSGGSSGGSWGSSGGYHHVRHHGWGSSGGSWGSSGGSSGGSWGGSSGGGWGSSGGSSGGYSNGYHDGGHDGGVIYGEQYEEGTPIESAPATPEAAEGKSAFTGAGLLLVKVPADAKVFVNGKVTTTTGTERQFVSRGLVRGASYNYEVKAEFAVDGKPVTVTKIARLTAGGNAELAFNDGVESNVVVANDALTTKLVVRVPSNAKVYLAGNETKQTGDVREFSTTKLGAGDGWIDYTVRAEFEQDGQTLTKEQVVSINAGESKEISFDFADGANDAAIIETAQK